MGCAISQNNNPGLVNREKGLAMTKKEVVELAKQRAREHSASAKAVECPVQGTNVVVLPNGDVCHREAGKLVPADK